MTNPEAAYHTCISQKLLILLGILYKLCENVYCHINEERKKVGGVVAYI